MLIVTYRWRILAVVHYVRKVVLDDGCSRRKKQGVYAQTYTQQHSVAKFSVSEVPELLQTAIFPAYDIT